MHSSYIFVSLAACIIAAPSPARIEIDVSVEDHAVHGASSAKHMPFMEHAVKTTDFCIPDIGRLCAFGDQSYDCCPPFSCTDDGSGRNVKRCLYKDDEGDQGTFTHNPKHQPQLSTTDDGDDDICLPPWQQGHMICGIGQPRFKCCASKFFECKPFGQSGIYGCQQKGSGDIDDAAVSPMGALDDDICLPPWDIAHMFCGVGQPKYRCCGPDMECKQLAPESIYYGCKFKNEDGNGGVLRKLLKEERVYRPELL